MSLTRTSTIPDFAEDARAQQQYKTSIDRRIKTYHADQEAAVRRAFAVKREALTAEIAASDLVVASRVETAQKAMAAYRARYPHRMVKSRPEKPSFVEWLSSFGRASGLYRAVTDANTAVIDAQSNQRRLAHKDEEFDVELGRAVASAEEKAKQTTTSPEWLAELHHDRSMGDMKSRVDAIETERTSFAKRLESGKVSDEELRDRDFAQHGVLDLEIPLSGMMFYRVGSYGKLNYFILRDLEKRLFALPYDPRLEAIVDGVFDVYRIADAYDVKQRVVEESKLPFTILNHFYTCNGDQEVLARAAYREQRAWMKPERRFGPTPVLSDLERDIIKLLADFAETIPSPKAPQII